MPSEMAGQSFTQAIGDFRPFIARADSMALERPRSQ